VGAALGASRRNVTTPATPPVFPVRWVSPESKALLGFICDQTGRVEQAFQYHKTALKLNPSFTAARNNLGATHFRQGKIDPAVEEFLRTLRYRPSDLTANYNLGLISTQHEVRRKEQH